MKTSFWAVFPLLRWLCIFMYLAVGASAYELPSNVKMHGFVTLNFNEEFNTFSLDRDNSVWNNALWYQKKNDMALYDVKDGVLSISADRNNPGVSTTTISRNGRGRVFKQGYFVARMRWNDEPHVWAAFWLFSYQHMMGTDHNKWCEIDVIESMKMHVFTGTVHNWFNFKTEMNSNNNYALDEHYRPNEWHDYGALVTADFVEWYLDGSPLFLAKKPPVCEDNDLFIVLSSQIHKNNRSPVYANSLEESRSIVQFDWVRVYTK